MTAPTPMPSWLPPRLQFLWPLDDEAVLRCLIVGEAEAEPYAAMLAVAWVPINRATYARESLVPWFARDVKTNCLMRHQFSCFWSDFEKRAPSIRLAAQDLEAISKIVGPVGMAIRMAQLAARSALTGRQGDRSFGADHYFNPGVVLPSWAAAMQPTVRVGHHDFYNSQG